MFIAKLFTIGRTWKQPKCPSTDEWIKKLLFIYTMEYLWLLFSHSVMSVSVSPWTAACQPFLSFTISWSVLQLRSHWVCDAMQTSHPLLSPSSPARNLSQHQGLYQWVIIKKKNAFDTVLMRWMNLESVIQSEVNQTEKDKYHILMHTYGI